MTDDRPPLRDAELFDGPEQRDVVLAPYDPQWPTVFDEHKERILAALGGEARQIEHIGSTAVPRLVAKPVIDIQVSVANPEHEPSYVPPLIDAGYVLRVREAGHRMLRSPALAVHVHVCAVGSDWERRHLLFRDWLRRSASDRVLYTRTKARGWPHRRRSGTPRVATAVRLRTLSVWTTSGRASRTTERRGGPRPRTSGALRLTPRYYRLFRY